LEVGGNGEVEAEVKVEQGSDWDRYRRRGASPVDCLVTNARE